MTTGLTKLAGSAFELTITIPWGQVKTIYDEVFEELAAEIEVEGFRKGKAPKNLIEEKIDKGKVYGEVINRIVPESYRKALEEHGLHPIVTPQVKIVNAEAEKDWQIVAASAEKPVVALNDYKKAISDINSKGKIWTPDQAEEQKEKTETEEQKSKKISEIIDKLLETSKVELPQIMIESETNRLLTQLLEDVRNAGLTYEQYLQSSNQTAETVKTKYHQQSETALRLEFVLEAIAEDLKIVISQAQLDEVIAKETDKNKQQALKEQSYILASVMRRDETIKRLLTL